MSTGAAATRIEGLVLVLILLTVAGFAGAASFTHVHDWTMTNSPPGTPGWFGWANAVISELVPIAALLTIRQRRRTWAPIGYPMTLLALSAGLSLAAQLAVAKPGPSGWLLSAVPAIAFMALAKLVLAPVSTTTTTAAAPTAVHESDMADLSTATPSASAPVPRSAPIPTDNAAQPASPTAPAPTIPAATIPAHLRPTAQFAIVNHEQHTGQPITVDELAARLAITTDLAGALLADLQPTPPPTAQAAAHPAPQPPARINGAAVLDGISTGGAR
jgi:hypothetical protein